MFRTVTYRINKQKNGIELLYGYAPSTDMRNILKKNGWRWNPKDQVWYARFSTESLNFAKMQSYSTEKRQTEIKKMPVFYRKHCGCEEEQLLLLQEDVFHKYVKHGPLKSIAVELLKEYVFEDALSLLKELYIQATKNETYRKELLEKIPTELYFINTNGSVELRDTSPLTPDEIYHKLDFQLSSFWKNLEIFGAYLRPIDRTAYNVANYRNKWFSNSGDLTVLSAQEKHLFSIVNNLTLDYEDELSQIIKKHLKIETKNLLVQEGEKNFYLLVLYSLIINDQKQADLFLSQYIDQITPKQVILNVERKRWMQHYNASFFDYGIKGISLKTTDGPEDELIGELDIKISPNHIYCYYSTPTSVGFEQREYFCEDKKWLEFANEFFNKYRMLEMNPREFSKLLPQKNEPYTLLEDGTYYAISIQKTDNTVLEYDCTDFCVGTRMVSLIREYFSPPRNAKRQEIVLFS